MTNKDSKAEPAKTEAKEVAKAEPAKKFTPEVKALAEKIFIQHCANNRIQGFIPGHHAKCAYEAAEAFLAYEPS